jgi:hypothetical protein
MQLTLAGLVRTLRRQAHALAEDVEAGYVSGEDRWNAPASPRATAQRARPGREDEEQK